MIRFERIFVWRGIISRHSDVVLLPTFHRRGRSICSSLFVTVKSCKHNTAPECKVLHITFTHKNRLKHTSICIRCRLKTVIAVKEFEECEKRVRIPSNTIASWFLTKDWVECDGVFVSGTLHLSGCGIRHTTNSLVRIVCLHPANVNYSIGRSQLIGWRIRVTLLGFITNG